jgi:hypothetical protein
MNTWTTRRGEVTEEGLKSGDWKMTVVCLQAGQLRAYADTLHTYRVFFHWLPYKAAATKLWEPAPWAENEALILPKLRAVHPWEDDPKNPFQPRLDFARKVGPGVWEFSVREEYTD